MDRARRPHVWYAKVRRRARSQLGTDSVPGRATSSLTAGFATSLGQTPLKNPTTSSQTRCCMLR